MKKILPINANPCMHSYTQHAYLHAIASSTDKVVYDLSDAVAEISVENYDSFKWSSKSDELTYSFSKERHMQFFTNKWNHGMNMAFWRDCKENDSIRFTIYKQLYSNAWSNISLFVTSKDTLDILQLNSYDIVAGNFAKDGIFHSGDKGFHNRIHYGLKMPITICLTKEQDCVYIQYENDSFSSKKILVGTTNSAENEYYIGFSVDLRNSIYYEWMFSNYIQLFSRTTEIIPIDFIVNWHKDWCVHTANHLIDYNKVHIRDITTLHISLLDFVKQQIDINQYIEIELNDNMKVNIPDEQAGPHFHQNLIYGYSDEKELLYVLYFFQGNIRTAEVSYSDFESERNHNESRIIYMLRYCPCYEKFELSLPRLLNVYKEYKADTNISFFDSFYDDGYFVGSKCFRQYCDIALLEKTFWDIRFPHLLYERATCNLNRVEYLYFIKVISEADYERMAELLKKEQEMLLSARNAIFKWNISGKPSLSDLRTFMATAYEADEKFTDDIINCLSSLQS